MTIRQAKTIHAGDTFERLSSNLHDKTGYRKFYVTQTDSIGLAVTDEHGYSMIVRFALDREWLKPARMIHVQQ